MPGRVVLGEESHGLLRRCSRPGCRWIYPRAEGVALPMWALNTLQSKMGFPHTTAAIHTVYSIEPSGSTVLCFFLFFVFFLLRGENCGKYFVFPGSQAMYLLQVLLNEL